MPSRPCSAQVPMNDSGAGPGAPISEQTRHLAGLLGREKTGPLLSYLGANPHRSASEVARALDIHVATAQRYLKDLADADLLTVRERRAGTRPAEEYALAHDDIHIHIDLRTEGVADRLDLLRHEAETYFVRDAGCDGVVYDVDSRTGYVEEILLLSDGERREVHQRLRIPAVVGRFLVEVPPATEPPRTIRAVADAAGLALRQYPEIFAAVSDLARSTTDIDGSGAKSGEGRALGQRYAEFAGRYHVPEGWPVLALHTSAFNRPSRSAAAGPGPDEPPPVEPLDSRVPDDTPTGAKTVLQTLAPGDAA